jgi:hypothetical protein
MKKETWFIYIFSPHQYWGAWKKKKILAKKTRLFSSIWISFFKLPQILGPIQVFASSLKHMIITI